MGFFMPAVGCHDDEMHSLLASFNSVSFFVAVADVEFTNLVALGYLAGAED